MVQKIVKAFLLTAAFAAFTSACALKTANKDDHYSSYDETGVSGTYYAAVTDLKAEASSNGITLTWTNSVNAPKYQILRRATSSGAFEVIGTTTDNIYYDDDSELSSGVTYYYEVVVLNDNNEESSVPSNIANAVYYAPPKLVDIEVVTDGITLTWETEADITDYKIQVQFQEVDANLVPSILPDVTIAVVNGNYALDAGLQAENALFKESEYADNSYYCLIAVRSEDAENPVYQRIVEAYQCDEVIDVYNSQFAGFFTPTWKLEG